MSRQRELLAARRAALRERVARRRAELAARREAARAKRPEKKKDRRWLLLVLLLLLMLMLLCRGCEPDPVPPPVVEVPAVAPAVGEAPEVAPTPPRITPKRRPKMKLAGPEELPWLTEFRLQVAARSPRLAACFAGVTRPGALKWTADVDPGRGRVSDQEIEPTLDGDELSAAQRSCVTGVLADPPYRLEGGDPATPARVGLVVEF